VYDDSDDDSPVPVAPATAIASEVPSVRRVVYDDSDGEVDKDQVLGREIPYDDSDDEGPIDSGNVEVVEASLQATSAESRPIASDAVAESTELETKTEPVAVELIDAADPSRMVELRPRGTSAGLIDDEEKLAEGDEWVPLRTRGPSLLEPAGSQIEELETASPLAKASQDVQAEEGLSLGNSTPVGRELKEVSRFASIGSLPLEPEAAEEEMVPKAPVSSSLFNPPARPILFGSDGWSKPSATTNSLQQRLQKKKEAEAKLKDQDVNIDNEADTFTLAGSQSKEGTTPWKDPRQQKDIDNVYCEEA
jgi:hypothetical protein